MSSIQTSDGMAPRPNVDSLVSATSSSRCSLYELLHCNQRQVLVNGRRAFVRWGQGLRPARWLLSNGSSVLSLQMQVPEMLCLVQAIAAVDKKLAQRAQAKYKSCVRTTLRLAQGYECQDLNGVFMLAFRNATDAICWAVLLNLALLQYAPSLAIT